FCMPPVVVEGGPAGLVLQDPRPGEGPVLDLAQDLPHLVANRRADDARPAGVVTELRRIADAVTHVAQAALVDEVDDQLHLVDALEIRQLRLVTRLNQSVKAR